MDDDRVKSLHNQSFSRPPLMSATPLVSKDVDIVEMMKLLGMVIDEKGEIKEIKDDNEKTREKEEGDSEMKKVD